MVIVDDEENSREALRGKLDLFCPEVEVVAEAGNVADGITALTTHQPDALFWILN